MYLFVNGVIAMGCLIAAIFFQRMAQKTSDRLFVFFTVAFGLLALERLILSAYNTPEESTPLVYLLRLSSFGCIIFGIVGKNLEASRRQ